MRCTWRWRDDEGAWWGCRAATRGQHTGNMLCAHHQRDQDVEAQIELQAKTPGDRSPLNVPGAPTERGFPDPDPYMYRLPEGGR